MVFGHVKAYFGCFSTGFGLGGRPDKESHCARLSCHTSCVGREKVEGGSQGTLVKIGTPDGVFGVQYATNNVTYTTFSCQAVVFAVLKVLRNAIRWVKLKRLFFYVTQSFRCLPVGVNNSYLGHGVPCIPIFQCIPITPRTASISSSRSRSLTADRFLICMI